MATIKTGATSISEKGLQIIRAFEGLILHPYVDKVGKWTIGYGSTEYENGKPITSRDPSITKERAEQLLRFEAGAKSYVLSQSLRKNNITLNQRQFDSLASFSYNTGIGGLLGSTLYRKIKANPLDPTIRDEFARWNKGHTPSGKVIVIDDLTRRRRIEAELYFS